MGFRKYSIAEKEKEEQSSDFERLQNGSGLRSKSSFRNYSLPASERKKKDKEEEEVDPLTTPEGLRNVARGFNINVPDEEAQTRKGFLGGMQKFIDVLSVGEYASGGIIRDIKDGGEFNIIGAMSAGIKEKITPSDQLIADLDPEEQSKFKKFAHGALKLATDVAFDPTTYLTLGTGSAIKVATVKGAKVALSKAGKEMLKDLAQEVGEKAARQQMAEAAMLKGNEYMLAKAGLKFAGVQVVSEKTMKAPFKWVKNQAMKTSSGRDLYEGLDKVRGAIGKTFNRDYGLDDIAKENKQKFLDGMDSSRQEVSDYVGTIFAGTTKAQREAIALAGEGIIRDADGVMQRVGIDKARASLDPGHQKLVDRMSDIYKQVHREEEALGLMDSWIENYVPHIYGNKEEARRLLTAVKMGDDAPSSFLEFALERKIPDLMEASERGLDPVLDAAQIMNARLVSSENAKLAQEFYKTTALTKGVVGDQALKNILELKQDLVKFGDVSKKVPEEFRHVFIPRNIADDMVEMDQKLFKDEGLNLLLKGYDKALNFFKGSVTVLFPAFHTRNAISNVMQNFLDIGLNAANPAKHAHATGVMFGTDGKLVTKLGTEYTYKQLNEMARKMGVLTNRVTMIDIERQFTDPAFVGSFKSYLNPFSENNLATRAGRKVGQTIEGEARLVNWLTNLQRGFSPEDAAARTKKFLFDYDNLSGFEKDVMRRMIPFYTWTRKNIALQVETLFKTPGKTTAQVKMIKQFEETFGQEKNEKEKKYAPDFVMAGMNVLLNRQGNESTFFLGFDLPMEAAFDFFNKPMKEITSAMTPFLKAPIEGITGYNFFKEKQIKDDDDGRTFENYPEWMKGWLDYSENSFTAKDGTEVTLKKVDPEKKWLLHQIETFTGTSRGFSQSTLEGINSMYRILKGEEGITNEDKWNVTRLLTGFKAYTIDIEGARKATEKGQVQDLLDILERHGKIGIINKAFLPKEEESEEAAPQGFRKFSK